MGTNSPVTHLLYNQFIDKLSALQSEFTYIIFINSLTHRQPIANFSSLGISRRLYRRALRLTENNNIG
jgi:hypothetical protein